MQGVVPVVSFVVLFFALLGGLGYVMVRSAHREAAAITATWTEWGAARGLAASGTYPKGLRLQGTWAGAPVEVRIYTTAQSHSSGTTSWSDLGATTSVPLGDLWLVPKGALMEVERMTTGVGAKTGDPDLDAAFAVRWPDDPARLGVLTPARIAVLVDAQRALGDVHVREGAVRSIRSGAPSAEDLERRLDAVSRIARALDAA